MAKITVDNSGNLWPGTVSIADLAQNTPILANDSDWLDIYLVEAAMSDAWPFEIERFEYEFATGYSAYFRDGTSIHIGAWNERDEDESARLWRAMKAREARQ